MQALQSIKSGNVVSALRELQTEVRAKPADPKLRIFLFQVLSLMGQWDRARNQLKVISELDALASSMVSTYSRLLMSEAVRIEVFAGRQSPTVVGEPERWIALLLQALKLGAEDHHTQAASLRSQAFDQAPATYGKIDGIPFEWISDTDTRFGPCLEVILNGGYSWVPFTRIKELKFEAPTDLRDKIWTPVNITWINDGQAVGFIPTRYPDSERAEDDALVLAARTEWRDGDGCSYLGLGQRMFSTDQAEYPLLDIRLIQIYHPCPVSENRNG